MESLKVRVNNEAESKEIQDLLQKLGFKKAAWGCFDNYFIFANRDYYSRDDLREYNSNNYPKVTIQQLRDLVVLKRNNHKDANVFEDSEVQCLYDLYLTSSGELYFHDFSKKQWILSNLNGDDDYYKLLKPISKMKEYLVPQGDGKYALTTASEKRVSDWVEVAEGADFYIKSRDSGNYFFFKEEGFNEYEFYKGSWILRENPLSKKYFNDGSVIWTRHTQPEELPFVDDEPIELKLINTQYAEIEAVRQHNHYFKDVSDIDVIDVYEVLKRFNVTDPCLQHIVKKALCAGHRGHKDMQTDLQDILDTAKRAVEINKL